MESQQPPPLPLPLPHATTTAHGRALENLRSLLLKCAIASAPPKSLSRQHSTSIEKRIQELVPTIHTPDHPTYEWMIENAMKQLNEEGVWDEEAISKFILEEHKDLPWAHAALLNHHLEKLSRNGTITKTHDGCYFIGISNARLSPSLSCSPSPTSSSTSSSSPTYTSSDSTRSFELKRGGKKKSNCRNKSQRQKQNARGIRTHPNYKQGRGHARGRGRGRSSRGLGWSCDNPCKEDMMEEACIAQMVGDTCVPTVEILSLLTEDEASDQREQANQDYYVHLKSQQQQSMVIDIEALDDEYRMIQPLQQIMGDNNCSTPTTIPRRKLTSEQGSKNRRQQRRNMRSRQTGKGRGRPRNRDLQMNEAENNTMNLLMEGETQFVNRVVLEDEDSMDELIDQVYDQLTEPTEIDGEPAEEYPQRKEPRQVEMNQEAVYLECQEERSSKVTEPGPQQGHISNGETIEAQQQNVIGGDYCSWRNVHISELGNDKLKSIQPKITPQTKDVVIKVAVEIMGPLEVAEIGDLLLQSEQETGERHLSGEGPIKQIEIRDHTEMQNKMSPQSVADQTYDIYDVESDAHECQITDEQQLQETKFAKHRKADQGICIEEQNQRHKLRPRPSRNESTNIAGRSKSSNARPAPRRRK